MYDAIVIGARVAGIVTAKLLADRGYRVLVVDRATFPSDTLSTHVFSQDSLQVLETAGLVDAAHSVGAEPLVGLRRRLPNSTIFTYFPRVAGYDYALCTRRILLDEALLRAAAEHPLVDVVEGVTATDLQWRDGRVVGITGKARGNGQPFEETARIVIGADGRRSVVAERAGARMYNANGPNNCAFYSYWTDVEPLAEQHLESYQFGELPGTIIGCIADRELWMWCTFMPQDLFATFAGRKDAAYEERLLAEPGLDDRMRHAKRVAPVRGGGDLINFFRVPWGPGWALVGDAGQHKDPIAGQGIGDALRSATYLVDALDLAWQGLLDNDAALAEYHARRDRDLLPTYERATRGHPPGLTPAEYQRYLQLIGQDPSLALGYVGVYVNALSARDFYDPAFVRQQLAERGPAIAAGGTFQGFEERPPAPVTATIPVADDGRAAATVPCTAGSTVTLQRPARERGDASHLRPVVASAIGRNGTSERGSDSQVRFPATSHEGKATAGGNTR